MVCSLTTFPVFLLYLRKIDYSMKKILLFIGLFLCGCALYAQENIPTGIMTYNSWSGKVSVGGETIQKDMLGHYFSEEDAKSFKCASTLGVVGGYMGLAGALPLGYGVGYLISWHLRDDGTTTRGLEGAEYHIATVMAIAGGVLFVTGFALNIPGEAKVKKLVNNYNASITYRPTLSIGATPSGFGLAYVF